MPVGIAALSAKSASLRSTAAEQLLEAKGAEKEVEQYLLSTLKNPQDTREMQYALSRVATLPDPPSVIRPFLDHLVSGDLAPELQLDVFEAASALADTHTELRKLLDQFRAQTASDGPLAPYDLLLRGGDPDVGEALFLGHPLAACSKCHALKDVDKQVGPSLQGIASRHPRSYLLHSIIDPQATVVPGYGVVTLALNNGNSVVGTLMGEDADAVEVKLPDGRVEKYARTAISSKSEPLSTMPDVKAILTKRELRDLVAYLATLR